MGVSALVVAAVLAVGQQIDPYDFEVSVDYRPDLSVSVLPSCVPDAGGSLCTAHFTSSETGRAVTGRGRQISTGRSGSFRTTCDWSIPVRAVFLAEGFSIKEFRELSGGGGMTCSWAVQLGSGTLSGDMRGNVGVGLAGPLTGRWSAAMSVNVVGGTGEFAGLVGGGTYLHSQTVDLSSGGRALAAAAAGSALELDLRKGKPAARIWAGRGTLWVITGPGSSCRISARKGSSVVQKTVRDGDRDGLLALRLARGRWSVEARCTHATARQVVRVT